MKTTSSGTPPVPRPEDENLGVGANMAYGLQHVLTMYGGIVAVPLILGQAAGLAPGDIGLLIAASLFAGGLATLLQTLGVPFFGCQLPLVQGCPLLAWRPWWRSSAAVAAAAFPQCSAR